MAPNVVQFEFNGTLAEKEELGAGEPSLSRTSGSSFSMRTKSCRRARSRNSGPSWKIRITRSRAIGSIGASCSWAGGSRHAYYPNWNLRLFKHRLGRYEQLTDVDTQSGDNEVHEHVVVTGAAGKLRTRDGSLRLSIRGDVCREAQPLLQLGSARLAGSLPARQRDAAAGEGSRVAPPDQAIVASTAVSRRCCAFFTSISGSAASSMAGRGITLRGCMASTSS